jgi:hypothetical protein
MERLVECTGVSDPEPVDTLPSLSPSLSQAMTPLFTQPFEKLCKED